MPARCWSRSSRDRSRVGSRSGSRREKGSRRSRGSRSGRGRRVGLPVESGSRWSRVAVGIAVGVAAVEGRDRGGGGLTAESGPGGHAAATPPRGLGGHRRQLPRPGPEPRRGRGRSARRRRVAQRRWSPTGDLRCRDSSTAGRSAACATRQCPERGGIATCQPCVLTQAQAPATASRTGGRCSARTAWSRPPQTSRRPPGNSAGRSPARPLSSSEPATSVLAAPELAVAAHLSHVTERTHFDPGLGA